MSEKYCCALKKIKEQLIGDYFTPTYRFEVPFDTLITPYIADIADNSGAVTNKIGKIKFVAKEMCLPPVNVDGKFDYGTQGAHIDYVLADDEYVYMVELKTSEKSIKSKQLKIYADYIGKTDDTKNETLTFGKVFGVQLAQLVYDKYKNIFKLDSFKPENFSNNDFIKFLEKLFDNPKLKYESNKNSGYTELSINYLKNKNKESTYKYLYTAAQVYMYLKDGNELWNKELKLIYITPTLKKHEKIIEILNENRKDKKVNFYAGTISMRDDAQIYLRECSDKHNDPLAQMLADVIKEIYGD